MASIFTYDPDPPRVASPWLQDTSTNGSSSQIGVLAQGHIHARSAPRGTISNLGNDDSQRVTRLQAEPQEGPIEYKLHLLLRPRRKFSSTSTGNYVPGSRHSRFGSNQPSRNASRPVAHSNTQTVIHMHPQSSTVQTRQHRLEQLTTQLLWRLQQSSPHHTSSATNMILPSLPEALPELQAPQRPAKLLHGLEESNGALYEIGVADDGTLVGLAEDEMHESLNNLRAMAACLGCVVEMLRRESVGDCEWLEDAIIGGKERKVRRSGKLVVVEALVKPFLPSGSPEISPSDASSDVGGDIPTSASTQTTTTSTEQLRVTLTGPTMSGKSSLLGTLTTSTLDNGRGKSRLSMLKHRHEITSGVTSSVTQELLGYQDDSDGNIEVVNYATDNAVSWIDIHVAASGNRLVFVSDSAGHPRYRRTTLRSLVGWSPHWTLLCVPADDTEDTASKTGGTLHNLGAAVQDMDLSGAQLNLCLRLNLPLVIVITKLDLASRGGLKASLSKVLDALKAAGKKPAILANQPGEMSDQDLQIIDAMVIDAAYNTALPLLNDPLESVPIVLTSAVQGTGIANLHALLHELPIPDSYESLASSGFVFDIEDIYSKPAEVEGIIVSGLLRTGQISIGDTGMIGPFSIHDIDDSEDSEERPFRKPHSQLPTSRSFPGAMRESKLASPHVHLPNREWRPFKVTSARNLRLPVNSLLANQVGTLAIVPNDTKNSDAAWEFGRIRKGMVLTAIQPQATRAFEAMFKREDLESLSVGNHVVVYVSSIRASARVVSARAPDSTRTSRGDGRRESNDQAPFEFDDVSEQLQTLAIDEQSEKVAGTITAKDLLVSFSFDASKEYVMVGDQVLVMPGGGPGLYGGQERGEKGIAGLDGFVGDIVETFG